MPTGSRLGCSPAPDPGAGPHRTLAPKTSIDAYTVNATVMLIGGASTLPVNGNPLLRFDGYDVLADLIGVPNLAPRGLRYLGYVVNRYLSGVRGLPRFPASTWERAA